MRSDNATRRRAGGARRGARPALALLAILLLLTACSIGGGPAPTKAPATVGPSGSTAPIARGTAGVPLPSVPPGGIPGTPGSFTLPPDLPVPTGDQVKVDSILYDIAVIYQQQGRAAAEQAARDAGLINAKNEVRLTLYLTDPNNAPVEAKIKELGGRVVASSEGVIDLVFTIDALAAAANNNPLAQLAAFSTVREIKVTPLLREQGFRAPLPQDPAELRAQMAAIVSEGVAATGANTWHAAGLTGKGVKIGIIDAGFGGYQALLGQELPAKVTARGFGSGGEIDQEGNVHGTACAEIIHAMAPDAELFLAEVEGPAGVATATDWLISQNVQIISMSLGRGGETRGDGSGPWAKPVDNARAKGIFFVVAAGNDGDSHYVGQFNDTDGDGWHEFATGKPGLKVGVGDVLDVVLRWDAWTGTPVNLDLYVFSGDGRQLLASSRNVQGGGQAKDPVEKIGIPLRREYRGQTFLIGVRATGAARPVTIELFTKNSELELFTPVGSVATPGDAKGAFTVGAANVRNGKLEDFSAQGPTADKRQKPDITAPDRVTTASYTKESPANPSFPGTSAACPHLSGAAALVLGAAGKATPDQLAQFLTERAQDIEEPGPDNMSGAGALLLGPPPGQQGGASSPPRPSASPASSARPSASPRAGSGTGKVTVTPDSAEEGDRITIEGAGFPANARLTLAIADEGGQPVASGQVSVGKDGTFRTAYDTTGDPAGRYTIGVSDAADNVIATADYTLGGSGVSLPSSAPRASTAPSARPSTAPSARPSAAPSARPSSAPSSAPSARPSAAPSAAPSSRPAAGPVLSISPNAAPSGTRFGISGAGFQPNVGLIVGVFDESDELVARGTVTTTAAGTFQIALDSTNYPAGAYSALVVTGDGKTALARATFAIR